LPVGLPDGLPLGMPEPPWPPPGPPLGQAVLLPPALPVLDEESDPQPASNRAEAASSTTAAGAVRRRFLRTRVMGQ
jgi:hypothetical protein